MSDDSNDESKTVWGKLTRVTKQRGDGFPLEITWRGKVFVWEGRLHRWTHAAENGVRWTLSTVYLEHAGFRNEVGDDPKFVFSESRWLAHLPGADGAERASAEDALEAALQYAIRSHHQALHELRMFMGAT